MAQLIQCPQCDRQLRVPDELLGKRVQCPSCGNTFVAPSARAPIAEIVPSMGEPVPLAPARAQRRPDDDDLDGLEDPPRYRRRRELADHRGGLILALGILSIVISCLGLLLGPIAWTLGNTDLAAMRAGRMDPEGESLTNAGRVCGIIGTVLGGLSFCSMLFWIVVWSASGAVGAHHRHW